MLSERKAGYNLGMKRKSENSSPDEQPTIVIREHQPGMQAEQIRREARRYGWRLLNIVSSADTIPHGMKPIGALLRGGKGDSTTKLVMERNIPFVRVGNYDRHYAKEGVSSVFIDLRECGKVAATFFADRGFSNLGFFGHDPWGDGEFVYERYSEVALEMGCQCHLFRSRLIKSTDMSIRPEQLQKEALELVSWIKGIPGPLGLLTFSDTIACRICTFVLDAGLRVPEDVAILSIGDNSFMCETAPVPISSVKLPWHEMWWKGFEYLNGILHGERERGESVYILPKEVVERQSTEVIPVNNPMVAEGLKFIWDNYYRDISVQDIVSSFSVSRSTIQRSFKSCLNRGFNEELRRKRLEVAERLLLQSKLTVAHVARKVGFNSRNYFHKSFIDAYGATPANYRKEHQHSDLDLQ